MRVLRKWVWAVVATAAATSPATAQMGTTSSGSASNAFSGSSGTTGASGVGNTGGGNSGPSGSNSGGMGSTGGSTLQNIQAAPSLTAPTGQSNNSLSSSNPFAGYYSNPYYQGIITQPTNATPGGFGAALYGNSSTGGTGSVNRGTGTNTNQNSQQSGILIPIPVQINYQAVMQFRTAPVPSSQMQADLRGIIDRTSQSQLANPKGVQVITDTNNNVTLRGTVADDEEARLVEGLVRLTPGVGTIRNELTAIPTAATAALPNATASTGR